jgi:protein gp37
MADKSAIEWTEATWNPIVGCSIVSPGCTNCYAMKMAYRLVGMGVETYAGLTKDSNAGPVWTGAVRLVEDALLKPLRWKRPRQIFVNSMSDLFHESVPDEWIDQIFAVIALAPQHTFQVLTKRADRMRAYVSGMWDRREHLGELMGKIGGEERKGWYAPECDSQRGWVGMHLPLPNVWLGVSTEDQARADERIPDLLATPAAVRWVSAEPLLGAIDFRNIAIGSKTLDALTGAHSATVPMVGFRDAQRAISTLPSLPPRTAALDWVVVGGESGPKARPMHPDWARSIRNQCRAASVSFFFKQWGNWETVYDRDRDDPDWRRCPQARDDRERYLNLAGGHGFHGDRVVFVRNVGKKAAGRSLDRVIHSETPLPPF